MKRINQIRPGDMIDLEGDKYADPQHNRALFECELALVGAVVPETPECIVLCIEGVDHFGFPPEHMVDVQGHDEGFDNEL